MKIPSSITKLSLLIGAIYSVNTYAVIEEVIVTAQKRAESSQDVPIAIQALSGENLAQNGITNSDDLGLATPGLQMAQGGAANVVFIRGMGNQDASGGQEGSVGTYVDGVWYGSVTGSALSFNNVERVEVIKGPQGTLFGRNTTGGVINIITKDPSDEPSASIGASYGSYDTVGYNFYGNTGLTENLAADLAVFGSNQGEGYGENLATGKDVNQKEDELFVRSKWKYTGDTWSATLSASYEEYSDDMGLARGLPDGSLDLAGNAAPSDLHDVNMDGGEPEADFESTTASLRLEKEFDNFDVLSITAWKEDDMRFYVDNDSMPLSIMNAEISFFNETITQEFQITSNDPDAKVTWIGGLFLMDQEAGGDYAITGPFGAGITGITGPGNEPNGVAGLGFGGVIETSSVAAFGEVGFNFTDADRLTVGLRYTKDKREVSGYNTVEFLPAGATAWTGNFEGIVTPEAPTPKQSETFKEPTWRIVYDHQFSEDVMIYGSYNRGFRSGNFNSVAPADPAFQPEILDAFEFGIKSDLADGLVRLNAAFYFYKVDDLQFQVLQGVTTSTVNAASATINGMEIDLTWQATDNLTLAFGSSFMNGKYDSFPNATANVSNPGGFGNQGAAQVIDAKGNSLAGAPEFIHTIAATYLVTAESGEYDANIRATYNGGYPWESDGRLEQEPYTLVNLSAGWRSNDYHWAVRLTAKNLLDEDYSVTTRAQTGLSDFYAAAAPRTYSIGVTYDF